MRLLLFPNGEGRGAVVCAACQNQLLDEEPSTDPRFHALSCGSNQAVRCRRHNELRNLLRDLLVRLLGRERVQQEVVLRDGAEHRMDIVCRLGETQYYVDVGVVDPTCQLYITRHASATVALAAATARESNKRGKYNPILAAMDVPTANFIPFIAECTGRLGKAADDWLGRVIHFARMSNSEVTVASAVDFFRRRSLICMLRASGILFDRAARARQEFLEV